MNPTQALEFVQQALQDYANTLAPSVRMPFVQAAGTALTALKPAPDKAEVPNAP